ncbi:MAG TPA: sigma-70 family RNA polymerase sigma factor, partial [bacterium]|nr:sigma-70 family RNA polymerase sigma factor [bacterium]
DTTDPLIRVELSELIENLSDADRKVFVLKASGYSIEEMANHMGISKTRVRQRLSRIKRKMEEYIDEI